MRIHWLKPLSALFFLLMVALRPADALSAAAGALSLWAQSVAPALLPFLIAAPALTCAEVSALLGRFTHPFLRLFGLPAHSTGALVIGLLSGSPAGASALSAVQPAPSDPPGSFLRAAVLASGASPSFLLGSLAVGMLAAPEAGWLLLRSQLLSALIACLLLRPVPSSLPLSSARPHPAERGAILPAMLTLLTIAGYMAFFSVLARLLSLFLHPSLETPLAALLELAGGCKALSALSAPIDLCLPLISAVSCFGGISVYLQSMSFLSACGVHPLEYAAGKLVHAALCALLTFLQLRFPLSQADPLLLLTGALLILLLTLIISFALRTRTSPGKTKHASPVG